MSPDAERGPRQGPVRNIPIITNAEHSTPDEAPVPLFGTIEWAAMWRVFNPAGVDPSPLRAADLTWNRAVARVD